MIYTLEHTGAAYAGTIPDDAWGELSRHRTIRAAVNRRERELSDDRRAGGPGTWRDHYRIVDESGEVVALCTHCDGTGMDESGPNGRCAVCMGSGLPTAA